MYIEVYKGFNKNFKVYVDTREKKNQHILNYFNKEGINYVNKKLDSGDYSFELDGISFEQDFIIERKSGLNELCNNFTRYRDRFKKEFERIKESSFTILLIENSTYEDVLKGNYRSKMHPNALKGSLKSWKEKYNFYVVFTSNNLNIGEYIYKKMIGYLKKFYHTEESLRQINSHIDKYEIEQIKLDI